MAIVDRKCISDYARAASQHEIDQPFAEIDAKKLDRARRHPGIRRFAEFSRRYRNRLKEEDRLRR